MPENIRRRCPHREGTPGPVRRPLAGTSLLDESDTPEKSAAQVPVSPPRKAASGRSGALGDLADLPNVGKAALRPLHERLSTFRQSVFGADGAGDPRPQPNLQPGRRSEAAAIASPGSESVASKPAVRPIIAQRTKPDVDVGEAAPAEPVLDTAANSPTAAEKPTTMVEKAPAASEADSGGGMLMARKGPVLSVETLGPRQITVGKESTYEVNIVNSGEVAGEELVVFVSLPEWAEVAGAEVSSGAAQANATGQAAGTVQWRLGHLDAKGRERLTLRIIPRQSRPFDLAVRWEYKPVGTSDDRAGAETCSSTGGSRRSFTEEGGLSAQADQRGQRRRGERCVDADAHWRRRDVPYTHKIGMPTVGEEKVLDVELTARQAGVLTIRWTPGPTAGFMPSWPRRCWCVARV